MARGLGGGVALRTLSAAASVVRAQRPLIRNQIRHDDAHRRRERASTSRHASVLNVRLTVRAEPRAGTLKGLAMRLCGLVIGALVILGSAISFAAPDLRLSLERSVITPAGLYAIAVLRIAIGLVFVLAAPASR